MSLVVSHVGSDFVTVGADRGAWATEAHGVPSEKPHVMQRSKIHRVPGVPVVIATVGAWYEGWIESWIAAHPVNAQAYSLPDYAKEFIADYFAYHDPQARKRLAECGLELPGKLQPHTPERFAASAQVIVAGLQPGWARAQVWTADYPSAEPTPLHFTLTEENGQMRRDEIAAVHVMGQFDPLRPFIEAMDCDMAAEQSAEVVKAMLDVRERLGRSENPIPALRPFDIVRITQSGVEWLEGYEGTSGAPSEGYVAAFDATGTLKATTTMNSNAPNVTPFLTNASLWVKWPSSSSTATIYLDDGSGNGVAPTFQRPDGSTFTAVAIGHYNPTQTGGYTISGLSTSSSLYLLVYYVPGSTGGANSTAWFIDYQQTPYTILSSQIITAYKDGGYIAYLATTNASTNGFANGTTGKVTSGGGGGRMLN